MITNLNLISISTVQSDYHGLAQIGVQISVSAAWQSESEYWQVTKRVWRNSYKRSNHT